MTEGAGITVSILIVSYNTREMTLACLRSVFEQTAPGTFEIIVLDNLSPDGSADAIGAEFGSRVKLIRSEKNLGFAGGNNVAATHAIGEYLLLLNPDTLVLDRAIDKLIAFARATPDAGIWGGRTQFADGSLNPASCWSRQTLWSVFCCASGLSSVFRRSSLFNPEAYGGWGRETEREVDIVSGCFLMLKRELWNTLGGFDRAFFMYGEEADLCLRSHKLGCRPRVTPTATIVHYGGASERVASDKMVRLMTAKTLLIRRHWSPALRGLGVRLLALWPFTRAIAWRVASVFMGARAATSRSSWQTVWNRRREWLASAASSDANKAAGA